MKRFFVLCASALAAVFPAAAQEARGRILGGVTDSSGAVVAEAQVRITNTATSQVAIIPTNDQEISRRLF